MDSYGNGSEAVQQKLIISIKFINNDISHFVLQLITDTAKKNQKKINKDKKKRQTYSHKKKIDGHSALTSVSFVCNQFKGISLSFTNAKQ